MLDNLTLNDEYLFQYSTPRLSGNVALFSPDACFDLVNITGNIDFENNPDVESTFCTGGRRGWMWTIDTDREKEFDFPHNFFDISLE